MKLYKLTDENGRTYCGTQWGPGVTHTATGSADQPLCTDGWIHFYTHPLLAALLNPAHANFTNPKLFEANGRVGKKDHGLKVGCRKGTTVKEMPLPVVSTTQRVAFGILATLKVYQNASYRKWAKNWLNGKDRSRASAAAAANAAAAFAANAAATSAAAAANAANAAAHAAGAAGKPLNLIAIAKQAMKVKP